MGTKARALYDFTAEPGTREISVSAGEILDVVNTEVGEGWWEGSNSRGQSGLFPAAYVETISTGPPDRPPPVLPPQAQANQNRYDQTADDWGNNAQYATGDFAKGDDGWDDDWDDDTYSEIGPGQTQPPQQPPPSYNPQKPPPYSSSSNEYPLPGMPIQEYADDTASTYGGSNTGTVVRKNKFSTFAKSGGDSYLLGTFNAQITDAEKVSIVQEGDSFIWSPITQPYFVSVASPKKESKFKGIKSFIAYQLTPSFNNIQVSRRYKHFDWLHERLTEKFCLIPIPPLPDKQISGRYEEQFIEHRRVQLQEFVDWVCRHPVLSKCEVWQHFLTCTDEKRWKAGKRQAEKDLLVGANYCITIFPPEKALLQSFVEQQTDQCNTFIHAMDSSVKNLMATAVEQTKKQQNAYKREFQKIGESFFSLGNAISLDEGAIVSTSKLTAAIRQTGGSYIEIGRMFEEQPKHDWEPLGDKLHIYKGIIGSYPDVLGVHKAAIQKRKECEKQVSDHKMEVVQLNEVIRRTDVVSYALLAEVSHFKNERTFDLNSAMQLFLKQQIHFYKKIVEKLETTLHQYEG